MKHSLTDPTPPVLSFSINLTTLTEAVEKCNLGLGDLASPINVNALIKSPAVDIPEYFSGETIIITLLSMASLIPPSDLIPDSDINVEGTIKMVNSTIRNVTKKLNYGPDATIALMEKVFVINPPDNHSSASNVNIISLLPDGSICLAPFDPIPVVPAIPTSCEINIQSEPFSACDCKNETCPDCTVYISYSIIFSLSGAAYETPYYFIIDPLLKISSGNRPENI